MYSFLMTVHVLLALAIIGLVLLQHGRGADVGAAFGSGASATVFGARGSASFLTRATAGLATLFFIVSLVLAILASRTGKEPGLIERISQPAPPAEQAAAGAEDKNVPLPSETDVPAIPGSGIAPVTPSGGAPAEAPPESPLESQGGTGPAPQESKTGQPPEPAEDVPQAPH